ncbi:metabotropic glutamate receptor 4 [Lingula anatina]|uniref:Metabotropic glutamate receptor 4 n=1 Tax=Lingula anatina TaxID=7574 RepID=A0A1S3HLH4_LINAN|nr:metabotropic glutamate receptor 4 [Lingula anatina]|eukprot:XP_013385864.1 metabotropic glutamate receptor 4 [Lingula anatina]
MLQHFIFTVMILTHHVLFKHAVLGEPNRYAIIPGDVLIGAIFPVHASASNPDSTQHSSHCGHIQEQDGIQPLEALMYTVDKINSDSSFLPGFSLGAVSLDSCDNTAYALEQSVEFVKLLVARISGDDGLSYTCPNGTKPKLVPGSVDFHKMVGVVGGASSTVSIYVANLLQLFKVPQISYLSTSPDLSNKERFPYFQRTVPSDLNQAQAIVELLKQNQWTYISAVYVDSNYGLKGFSELEKRAEKAEICFALRLKVPVDPNAGNYRDVVEALFEKQEARVVVLYLDTPQARALFAAVNSTLNGKRQRRNKLIWIGSDAWSARQSVVEELEHVAEDAITVQPLAEVLPGFDEYFTR